MKKTLFLLLLLSFSIASNAQENIPVRPTESDWSNPTGSYKVIMEVFPTLPEHTIYHPVDMTPFKGDNKLPVLLMSGPGTDYDGDYYRPFWTEIASYGYVVIAIGPPLPDGTRAKMFYNTKEMMLQGMDWITEMSKNPESIFYQTVNPDNMALFGQSFGGTLVAALATDSRVKSIGFWNSGVFDKLIAARPDADEWKLPSSDYLKEYDRPVLYVVGETDFLKPHALEGFEMIGKAPTFYAVHATEGDAHAGTFKFHNGGAFSPVAVSWLNWTLKGDNRAGKMFCGKKPGLQEVSGWVEIRRKNID